MSFVSWWLFLLEPVDLFGDVDGRFALHVTQLFDLGFEFGNRLLELEEMSFAHPAGSWVDEGVSVFT
jgi:hypothetical protein